MNWLIRDFVIGVIGALSATLVIWLSGFLDNSVTRVVHESIVENDDFRGLLVAALRDDDAFGSIRGKEGLRNLRGPQGPQGERGPKGEDGRDSPLYGQKFCVLEAGGKCPSGFSNGAICIDSEDDDNRDFISGEVGDSGGNKCGGSSKMLLLCCN